MVDIESIRQIIQMMVENDLVEVSVRRGDEELTLRRPNATDAVQVIPSGAGSMPVAIPGTPPAPPPTAPAESAAAVPDANLLKITSPMVGTFYSASSPDTAPFVTVGSEVQPDTVVCIIEAMKVFNEIKAEVSGTIEDICVTNQAAVEFGQPLFSVRRP